MIIRVFIAFLTFAQLFSCRNLTAGPDTDNSTATQALPNQIFIDYSGASALQENILAMFPPIPQTGRTPVLAWPLKDQRKRFLSRFGTVQIAIATNLGDQDQVTGQDKTGFGILHEAVDISRSSANGDSTVFAPVSGKTHVISDADKLDINDDHYSTAIVIQDSDSGHLVALLHVKPDARFFSDNAKQYGIDVTRGEQVGELATTTPLQEIVEPLYRHMHVFVVNEDRSILRNPAHFFPDYRDTKPPVVVSMYILDEGAKRHNNIKHEELDIVLEAYDPDDVSSAWFEVAEIDFSIRTDTGTILHSVQGCQLERLFNSFRHDQRALARIMYDLGNATDKVDTSAWRDIGSDAINPQRTYRLVLTHLQHSPNGCRLVSNDREGFVRVTPEISQLIVEGVARDWNGNATSFRKTFK